MKNFFQENKSTIIITILSIIVAFILGIYTPDILNDKVNLQYSIKSVPIASIQDNNYQDKSQKYIEYNNNKVERITSTSISIFNNGNKALDGNIISQVMPIQAVLNKNYKILNVFIDENNTSSAPNFSLKIINNKVIPKFKYMNKGDKITFTILHTGISDNDIEIKGNWKDFNGIKKYKPFIEIPLIFQSIFSGLIFYAILELLIKKKFKKEINSIKTDIESYSNHINDIKQNQIELKQILNTCNQECKAHEIVNMIDEIIDNKGT